MTKWLNIVKSKITWGPDLIQVLVLDRLFKRRRNSAMAASALCRALKVHSRSPIPSVELRELLKRLNVNGSRAVVLPSPAVQAGSMGDPRYYYALGALISALQPKTILEIGTYLGVGTCCMAMNSPLDCRIVTVDLPDDERASVAHMLNTTDERHIVTSRHRVGEAFIGTRWAGHVTQVRADSLLLKAEEEVSNVDFSLVDGGHSLPCITADTENALRVMAVNGVIVWDDYFHLYPEVVTYLDVLSRRLPLRRIVGTNLVLYSSRWHIGEEETLSASA